MVRLSAAVRFQFSALLLLRKCCPAVIRATSCNIHADQDTFQLQLPVSVTADPPSVEAPPLSPRSQADWSNHFLSDGEKKMHCGS